MEEAHNVNMRVAAHCHGGQGADWCIETGLDSIEHGAWCTMDQYENMAEKGTWLVPTLAIIFHETDPGHQNQPPEVRAKMESARNRVREYFPRIVELGLGIAAGTDNLHGMLWRELECMVDLGMSPMAALLTATRHAAELCRKEDDLGTLAPGKLADIIAVKGNPLAEIVSLKNVVLVMKGGRCCDLSD